MVIAKMTARQGHCYNDRKTRSLLQLLQDAVIVIVNGGYCYNDHITNQHNNRPVIVTMTDGHHNNDLVCDLCCSMLWSLLQWSVVILTMTTTLSCRTLTTYLIADLH